MHATLFSLVALLASTSAVLATPTNNNNNNNGPSSCQRDEFWWSEKSCCLKNGGPSNTPTVPTGKSCPDKWYWHSGKSCCTPRNPTNTPTSQSPPTCPGTHIWDTPNTCCRAPTKNDCKPNSEWWWDTRSCCLSHGAPPNPPSPPTGNKCPSGSHSWNNKQGCCAPHHPNPPEEPDCGKDWKWNKPTQCCKPHNNPPPPPTPSHRPYSKKDEKAATNVGKRTPHSRRKTQHKQTQFCPAGFSQCPVRGVLGEYECVDTMSELESCGGCASLGKGKDCNKIANATTSSCLGGVCVVLACEDGYKISADGESCVNPLSY